MTERYPNANFEYLCKECNTVVPDYAIMDHNQEHDTAAVNMARADLVYLLPDDVTYYDP